MEPAEIPAFIGSDDGKNAMTLHKLKIYDLNILSYIKI